MYQNIWTDVDWKKRVAKTWIWDDERGLEHFDFEMYAYKKDASGRHTTIFGDPVKRVTRWRRDDPDVFESDVHASTRVLIDTYYKEDRMSTGHRTMLWDIEVATEPEYPDIDIAQNPITAISYRMKESGERGVFLWDPEGRFEGVTEVAGVPVQAYKDEKDLLFAFVYTWATHRPTIVSGWNSEGFDVPYLIRRIRRIDQTEYDIHGNTWTLDRHLSPIGQYKENNRGVFSIAGVSHLDYMLLYKKLTFSEEASYALDAIAKKVVGRGKVEYEGSLDQLLAEDPQTFIDYSMTDVDLIYEIDEKMTLIDVARGIAHTGCVPYEDVYMSSRFIDGGILRYLKGKRLVAPNKPSREGVDLKGRDKFEGAYVKEPVPGCYDWVFDLDYTSLYPTNIMANNISPETKLFRIKDWDYTYLDKIRNGIDRQFELYEPYLDYESINASQIRNLLDQNQVAIASNGTFYFKGTRGLIPTFLKKGMDDKDKYDALMDEAGAKAKAAEDAGDAAGVKEWLAKQAYYKLRRTVAKVINNSVYGTLGLPIFRFYDEDNAHATTSIGQVMIKYAESEGSDYLNRALGAPLGTDHCIYVDTDSVFFSFKDVIPNIESLTDDEVVEKGLVFARDMQDYLNDSFDDFVKRAFNVDPDDHAFNLKFELIARRAMWIKKKRYCAWIVNEKGHSVTEGKNLDVKGLDTKRSSFPSGFKGLMKEMMIKILTGQPADDVSAYLSEFIDSVPELPIGAVVCPTGVKEMDKWVAARPENVAKVSGVSLNGARLLIAGIQSGRTKTLAGTGLEGYFRIRNQQLVLPVGQWHSGCPNHVKAALAHNDLMEHLNVSKKYAPIREGEKIRWVYLKPNPYQINSLAFKGYDDAPEIMDYVEKYADRVEMYNRLLDTKLRDFYNALKWTYPTDKGAEDAASQFFSF